MRSPIGRWASYQDIDIATSLLAPMPVPRISRNNPEFEIGPYLLKLPMISMNSFESMLRAARKSKE